MYLSDIGLSRLLDACPMLTSVAGKKSAINVSLLGGLRSHRLLLEYLTFRTPTISAVLVPVLQCDERPVSLPQSDLLATLLHLRTDKKWLLRALIEHRSSAIWRHSLTNEDIAALAGVSSREVTKHV